MDQDMRAWRVYKCDHIQFATKPPRAGIGLLTTYASGKHNRAPFAWVPSSLCKLTGLEDVIACLRLYTYFCCSRCFQLWLQIAPRACVKFLCLICSNSWGKIGPNQGRIWAKVKSNLYETWSKIIEIESKFKLTYIATLNYCNFPSEVQAKLEGSWPFPTSLERGVLPTSFESGA